MRRGSCPFCERRENHHSFTKGESFLTNLITFYNEMTGLVDAGRAMDKTYLHFSRAFDAVSHKILIENLLIYGLGESTVWWTEK